MENGQREVARFHNAFGVKSARQPRMLPQSLHDLRVKLIREELKEFEDALKAGDTVEAYDALLDILVVTYGALDIMGMDAEPGLTEVFVSNMSKLDADGKPIVSRGEEQDGFPAGKILKGPNYRKPDLVKVLRRQGYEEEVVRYWMQLPKTFKHEEPIQFTCGDCGQEDLSSHDIDSHTTGHGKTMIGVANTYGAL